MAHTPSQTQILGSSTFKYRYHMSHDFTAQEVVVSFKANRLEYSRFSQDLDGVQELLDLLELCLEGIHTFSSSRGRNAIAWQVGGLMRKAEGWSEELYHIGSGFAEASGAFCRRYPEARRLYENEGESRGKR
ncbi:MAG: hypothetical protein Q9208_003305 [Pyrenodesmia sp. 3 TL-2023]